MKKTRSKKFRDTVPLSKTEDVLFHLGAFVNIPSRGFIIFLLPDYSSIYFRHNYKLQTIKLRIGLASTAYLFTFMHLRVFSVEKSPNVKAEKI